MSAGSGQPSPKASAAKQDPAVRRATHWFSAALATLAIVEAAAPYLLYSDHGHFWFEDLPAWSSVYGLVACVLIITVSKLVGKLWLMRPEAYYDWGENKHG
jgi:hypothetical protein